MHKVIAVSLVLALIAVIAATVPSGAQSPPGEGERFRLGLGDLMTAFMQPRHAKLGIAGQARNWDYLAYEQREFEETLELIQRAVPRYRGIAMSDLMQILKDPTAALGTAIKARDGAAFDAAYARLTDACNACHVATDHRMVVIQVPRTPMFPNQNFAPQPQ